MDKDNANKLRRVIGLDCHPDTFTASELCGNTPAEAREHKTYNKVPVAQLTRWAQKHTTPEHEIVLEASGNSFHVHRLLTRMGRQVRVLESTHLGKLKEAHANNDKISAVRIAKSYLAGTAREVWVPDPKTQERRDWMHAHAKAVKRTTQLRNRLLSYLSDHGVRLKQGTRLTTPQATDLLHKARDWSAKEWQVLDILLIELRHAEEQRRRWRTLIAQEVCQDERLLSLIRLCGVRELIAFALGAVIGDIQRFADPRKLVKYVGLTPAFDDSGNETWRGGIGGHGRRDLRNLLIEAAQSLLRSKNHPLRQWATRLLARKGSKKLVVAAVARRLTTSIWYLMMGRTTPLEQIDEQLKIKVTKVLTHVGATGFKQLKTTRAALRSQIEASLRTTKLYVLAPDKKMPNTA